MSRSMSSASASEGSSEKRKSGDVSLKDKLRTKKQRYDVLLKKSAPVRCIIGSEQMFKLLVQSLIIGSKTTLAYLSSEKVISDLIDLLFYLTPNCAQLAHAAWNILTVDSPLLDILVDVQKPHLERFWSFLDQDESIRTGAAPSPSDLLSIWLVPNVFFYFSTTFRRWLLTKPDKIYAYLMSNNKKFLDRLGRHLHSVDLSFILISILKTEKKVPAGHPAHQWAPETIMPYLLGIFASRPVDCSSWVKEVISSLTDWQPDNYYLFCDSIVGKHFPGLLTAILNPRSSSDANEIYLTLVNYVRSRDGRGPNLIVSLTKQIIQNVGIITKLFSSNCRLAQTGFAIVEQQLQRGGIDLIQATLPYIIQQFFKMPRWVIFAQSVSLMLTSFFTNEKYQVFHKQLLHDLKFVNLVADAHQGGQFEKHLDWGLFVSKIVVVLPEEEKTPLLLNIEKNLKQKTEIPMNSLFSVSSDLRKQQHTLAQQKLGLADPELEKDKDKEKERKKKPKKKTK